MDQEEQVITMGIEKGLDEEKSKAQWKTLKKGDIYRPRHHFVNHQQNKTNKTNKNLIKSKN